MAQYQRCFYTEPIRPLTHSQARLMVASVLSLLVLLLWSPSLLHGGGVRGVDISHGFYPIWSFAWRWLKRGVIPWWNPHVMSGLPFFGEPHGMFYPPHLLLALLPMRWAIVAILLGHSLLACTFTYGLCRALALSRLAASFAAVSFALTTYTLAHIHAGHVPQLETTAWLPALFWLLVRQTQRPSRYNLALVSLVLALLVLIGHVQFVFYSILFAGLFVLISALRARLGRRQALAQWSGVALAVALGLGLVAFQLVPMLLWSRELARGTSYQMATEFSLTMRDLMGLLTPMPFGDTSQGNYHGSHMLSWEVTIYLGILVLLLAFAALTRRRGREFAIVGLVAFLLSFGSNLPGYQLIYRYVPGFSLFRVPTRIYIFAALSISVLAAIGLDLFRAWLRKKLPRRRLNQMVPLILVALSAADLLRPVGSFVAADDYRDLSLPKSIVEAVKHDDRGARVSVVTATHQLNSAMIQGFDSVGGYEGGTLRRYNRLIGKVLMNDESKPNLVMAINRFHPALGILGLRYLVVSDQAAIPASQFRTLGGENGVALYATRNDETVVPRAWLVQTARLVADETAALARITEADFAPLQEVVLEQTQLAALPPVAEAHQPLAEPKMHRPDPNHLTIDVSNPTPSYLVLSEVAYPGWHAQVNGQPAPIYTGDFVLRTVPLGAGPNHVVLWFRPPGQKLGLALSLLSLLLWLLMSVKRTKKIGLARAQTRHQADE